MFSDIHLSFSVGSQHTVISISTEGVDHVLSKTKWDQFGFIKCQSLAQLVFHTKS